MTHQGSCNASAIDMLARGIRVIAPRGFRPRHNVRRFRIPEFDDMGQMLDLISRPVDAEDWLRRREACTDKGHQVAEVAREMSERWRRFLVALRGY